MGLGRWEENRNVAGWATGLGILIDRARIFTDESQECDQAYHTG